MNAPICLGIDHVVIRTADTTIFEMLSGPLGLPVTWPLQRASFASFGWINVGNTHLEIWAATDNSDLPLGCPLPLLQQIALAPIDLSASLAQLEAVGVRCKAPRSFQSMNGLGALQFNFTNSVILDLSSDACCVFFCDWDAQAPIAPWPKGLNASERRQAAQQVLTACGGGALGVVGLRRIALQTQNLERCAQTWRALAPAQNASPKAVPLMLTEDIELRLSAGPMDAIESLTFAVSDLPAARDVLFARGLLSAQHPDRVGIAMGGVALYCIQA